MQVLSLTELPISEGESGNIQGWVKERDHLLTTVQSLKGLITHIQIKVEGNERLCIIIMILCLSVYLRALCAPADIRQ